MFNVHLCLLDSREDRKGPVTVNKPQWGVAKNMWQTYFGESRWPMCLSWCRLPGSTNSWVVTLTRLPRLAVLPAWLRIWRQQWATMDEEQTTGANEVAQRHSAHLHSLYVPCMSFPVWPVTRTSWKDSHMPTSSLLDDMASCKSDCTACHSRRQMSG